MTNQLALSTKSPSVPSREKEFYFILMKQGLSQQ